METVLEVKNLSVGMISGNGTLVPVLENLSFSAQAGRTAALVGNWAAARA